MVNGSLHVVVPEGYSHNVDVDSSSGEVTVDYLDIDSFNVKASSGDIELDHINANDMTAKTSSGRITGDDIHVEGQLNLDSSSGDKIFNGILAETVESSAHQVEQPLVVKVILLKSIAVQVISLLMIMM